MATPARALIKFNVQAASNNSTDNIKAKKLNFNQGRRSFLWLSTATTATTAIALVADSRTEILNEFLKKSQENKAKNDEERLFSYYKRNYKDYFGLLEGDLRQKTELTESEKGILDWLDKNK